jgi:RNA polymerase sigma factor (sigma-70 family)
MKSSVSQSNKDDIQAWIALKDGSESALGQLINKFFNTMKNYGYGFVPDEDFVKDCVQEVFIEIWKRRDRVSIPTSVKAYLLSSVRKKVQREGFRQKIIKDNNESALDNSLQYMDFSAEWSIIEQEKIDEISTKVHKSMNQLPKRQREVLYLQYYQNLSRDEISDIMEINTQSVSNLLQTAFKSFRENWA